MHPLDFVPPAPFLDLRDYGPLHQCVCGCDSFIIVASFEDYEINSYMTEGRCVECGAKLIVPTEIDRPGYDAD